MDNQQNPIPPAQNLPDSPPSGSWLAQNRKMVILGVAAVVLLSSIVITSWWQRRGTEPVQSSDQSSTQAANTAGSAVNATDSRPTFQRYQVKVTPDSDRDGLVDDEERRLGTDPDRADTDGDGLTDYDEVVIYSTDPISPDTDGDGFSDGTEVNNRKNPNGPGELLNLPQAVQNISNTNQ